MSQVVAWTHIYFWEIWYSCPEIAAYSIQILIKKILLKLGSELFGFFKGPVFVSPAIWEFISISQHEQPEMCFKRKPLETLFSNMFHSLLMLSNAKNYEEMHLK